MTSDDAKAFARALAGPDCVDCLHHVKGNCHHPHARTFLDASVVPNYSPITVERKWRHLWGECGPDGNNFMPKP